VLLLGDAAPEPLHPMQTGSDVYRQDAGADGEMEKVDVNRAGPAKANEGEMKKMMKEENHY